MTEINLQQIARSSLNFTDFCQKANEAIQNPHNDIKNQQATTTLLLFANQFPDFGSFYKALNQKRMEQ